MVLNDLYIGYSKTTNDKNNLGVYSKRAFQKDETIEIAPFIEVKTDIGNLPNPLQDYVFGSHITDGYTILVFGYGSMYNHSLDNNVSYSTFKKHDRFIKYYANRFIPENEELFINYGENHNVNKLLK